MTLQSIENYVALQGGSMGSEDGFTGMDENKQTLVLRYINEGYETIVNRKWKPYAVEQVKLDANGDIDPSLLSKPCFDVLSVGLTRDDAAGVLKVAPQINPLNQSFSSGESFGVGLPNQVVWVKYQYSLPPLTQDSDMPLLPEQYHAAIGDYATWRLLSTGSADKQSRANFFWSMYNDKASTLRPYGVSGATSSKIRIL